MRLIRSFLIGMLAAVPAGLVLGGLIVLTVPFISFRLEAADLSSPDRIMNRNNTGLTLLDRNGLPFYHFYQAKRSDSVELSAIPLPTRQAVLAAEDKDFYSHAGFSPKAIIGSFIADLRHQEAAYGGSTITQQLAKNAFLSPDKTWERKLAEVLLSQELESKYSKDQILSMYLNSAYFGEGAFGIQDAAETYFSVPASELNLQQSALLAGILTAPSAYSPVSGDAAEAKARKEVVLDRMAEQGWITAREAEDAKAADIALKPGVAAPDTEAPHFALMVRQALIDQYGEQEVAHSGYVVTTTLDPVRQAAAEQAVSAQVAALAKDSVSNGAAVVIDPASGEVRAVVGSKDWNDPAYGKFNVATALRQPGSSFKPIVYLAAFEKDLLTPASILKDVPTTFGTSYRPLDYDLRFRGNVTVRRALSNSLNIPTVQAGQKVGVPAILAMAKRLGVTSLGAFSPNDLSVSLGSGEVSPLEMTNVYATLARGGTYLPPVLYTRIADKYGDTVYAYAPAPVRAVDPAYAYLVSSILSDNAARREVFGSSLSIAGRTAAVKTGTSNSYKDSWTIGYTPSLAIGVWVGNNDGTPMDNVAGSLGAAPIWKKLMQAFLDGTPDQPFAQPEGVRRVLICRTDGLLAPAEAKAGGEYYYEAFAAGTEPTRPCGSGPAPQSVPSPSEEATPEVPNAFQEESAPPEDDPAGGSAGSDGTTVQLPGGGSLTLQPI